MSNYGALAILALTMKRRRKVPSPDEADLRWLIVLETFPADAKGWRQVGAHLLAEEAGLAYSTSRAARDRLVAAGVVEYRPGNGRGKRSSYRFAAPLKVPTLERHLAETGADDLDGPNKGAELGSAPFPNKGADSRPAPSGAGKGAETPPRKVPRHAKKGAEHNPLTSGNENTALEAFALDTSALSPCPNALHEALAAVVPDVTERETELVIEILNARPAVQSGTAVLPREIRDGNAPDLVAEVRRRQAGQLPPSVPPSAPTPAPPQYADCCGWCSRPGHDAGNCPDRPEPAALPVLATDEADEDETPCAAGDECHQRHTRVDDDQKYHEACQIFGGLRAAAKQAKRADRDEVGRRTAREQLDALHPAAPSQDGGHAA